MRNKYSHETLNTEMFPVCLPFFPPRVICCCVQFAANRCNHLNNTIQSERKVRAEKESEKFVRKNITDEGTEEKK